MIKINTEIYVPPGMYCQNRELCGFIGMTDWLKTNMLYCSLFSTVLEEAAKGKQLKCEQCLLATRKAMEG